MKEVASLAIAGAIGTALVVPSQLAVATFTVTPGQIAFGVVQSWVEIVVAVWIGLSLARRIGLGAPILEAALRYEPVGVRLRKILPLAIALGIAASASILVLDRVVFAPRVPAALGTAVQPPAWAGFLASFYGAFAEELLTRLFLVSLFAWLLRFVLHDHAGRPSALAMWPAIGAAAILFGIGHLPATSLIVPITPLIVARAIVLNGIGGVVFGWMYWRRGLEAAMLAHFSADLVLHVLWPMFA